MGRAEHVCSAGTTTSLFPSRCTSRECARKGSRSASSDPVYGKVYHLGSSEDLQKLLEAENGYCTPRTRGPRARAGNLTCTGTSRSRRAITFLGLDFTQAMGTDLSEKRMTEYRSFDASDTMNNLQRELGV